MKLIVQDIGCVHLVPIFALFHLCSLEGESHARSICQRGCGEREWVEGRLREDPVQVVDWMPTLISMLNLQPQQDHQFDGTDIWPLISAGEPTPPRDLFWNFRGDYALGLRHGDWKLISSADNDTRKLELFNIGEDPGEEIDLAQEREDVVAELMDLIEQERRADGSLARSAPASTAVLLRSSRISEARSQVHRQARRPINQHRHQFPPRLRPRRHAALAPVERNARVGMKRLVWRTAWCVVCWRRGRS